MDRYWAKGAHLRFADSLPGDVPSGLGRAAGLRIGADDRDDVGHEQNTPAVDDPHQLRAFPAQTPAAQTPHASTRPRSESTTSLLHAIAAKNLSVSPRISTLFFHRCSPQARDSAWFLRLLRLTSADSLRSPSAVTSGTVLCLDRSIWDCYRWVREHTAKIAALRIPARSHTFSRKAIRSSALKGLPRGPGDESAVRVV